MVFSIPITLNLEFFADFGNLCTNHTLFIHKSSDNFYEQRFTQHREHANQNVHFNTRDKLPAIQHYVTTLHVIIFIFSFVMWLDYLNEYVPIKI